MLNTHCWKLAVLLLTTVCVGVPSPAVEPEHTQTKRFIPASVARFELVLGRLQLSNECFRIGAAFERAKLDDGSERTRSISISTYRGKPTLQFRDSGGVENVHLSFKADRKVDIEQSVGSDRERYTLVYQQADEGPVLLRVDFSDGRAPLECHSQSLWHLAIDEPRIFDEYMLPCLMRLEPSWQIAHATDTVRNLKNRPVCEKPVCEKDATEFHQLIEQLDAELASERTSAMIQLESIGVAAEQRLRQCLTTQLSSQQEQSIKRLLADLQPTGSDTPMRVAIWLSDDLK